MKRSSLFITMLIITLLALLTVLSNILSNLASSQIPSAFIPYLRLAWPTLGLVTLLSVGFTAWLHFQQQSSQTTKAIHQTKQNSTPEQFGKLVVYMGNGHLAKVVKLVPHFGWITASKHTQEMVEDYLRDLSVGSIISPPVSVGIPEHRLRDHSLARVTRKYAHLDEESCAAIFEHVLPGDYLVWVDPSNKKPIAIFDGNTTQVDWRKEYP